MKYYHATSFDNVQKIITDKMIKKGFDGVVYLCDSIENASKFLKIRGMNEFVVFELDGLDPLKLEESYDHSESFFKCKAWCYPEDINMVHHWVQSYVVQGEKAVVLLDEEMVENAKSLMQLEVVNRNENSE